MGERTDEAKKQEIKTQRAFLLLSHGSGNDEEAGERIDGEGAQQDKRPKIGASDLGGAR